MRIFSKNNESGVILVTVIMLIIALSIVTIGIMSLNVSQIKTASSVVDTIKAQELAVGVFYQDYQRRVDGLATNAMPSNMQVGSKTFQITRTNDTPAAGPNNTNQLQLDITY